MSVRAQKLRSMVWVLVVCMVSFLLAVSEAHAAPTVARKAGQDRYETSKNVVLDAFTASDWAVVCTGESFADALSATGLAGALGCPPC